MVAAPPPALSTAPGSGGTRRLVAAGAALLLLGAAAALLRASPPTRTRILPFASRNDDPTPSPPTPQPPAQDDDFSDGDDPEHVRYHWALIIAGSSGWGNYRHQSDAFHAYRVLTEGGFSPSHVVLMAADDIAHSRENPSPGKVFNHPRGPDNYRGGGFVDYKGQDVTSRNFLAVLEGDAEAVRGIGTERVIASTQQDRVFLFYSDHGSVGVLGMPAGPFLFADELHASLGKKADKGGFKEMVLYIEACEAGSMFQGLMRDYDRECGFEDGEGGEVRCEEQEEEDSGGASRRRRRLALAATPAAFFAEAAKVTPPEQDQEGDDDDQQQQQKKHHDHHDKKKKKKRVARLGPPVYVTTAANADESSWATYCPSFGDYGDHDHDHDRPAAGVPDDTCLGDLYSVAWMEDADASDLSAETLSAQFALVKERTSDGGTYDQGSHAMAYGAVKRMGWEVAGDYLGMMHTGGQRRGGEEEEGVFSAGRALLGGKRASAATPPAPPPPRSHPHRMRQHEAYAAPLVLAARRLRLGAEKRAREANEAVVALANSSSDAARLAAALPVSASRRRRLLLEEAVGAGAANADSQQLALALTAAREAEAAEDAAKAADAAVKADAAARRAVDVAARRAARVLLREGRVKVNGAVGSNGDSSSLELALVRAEGPLFSRAHTPTLPAVDDWDCLRAMVSAWDRQRQAAGCSPVGGTGGGKALGQYAMRHTRLLAALCNAGVEAVAFERAVEGAPCLVATSEEEERVMMMMG